MSTKMRRVLAVAALMAMVVAAAALWGWPMGGRGAPAAGAGDGGAGGALEALRDEVATLEYFRRRVGALAETVEAAAALEYARRHAELEARAAAVAPLLHAAARVRAEAAGRVARERTALLRALRLSQLGRNATRRALDPATGLPRSLAAAVAARRPPVPPGLSLAPLLPPVELAAYLDRAHAWPALLRGIVSDAPSPQDRLLDDVLDAATRSHGNVLLRAPLPRKNALAALFVVPAWPPQIPAAADYALDLLRSLLRLGHSVHILPLAARPGPTAARPPPPSSPPPLPSLMPLDSSSSSSSPALSFAAAAAAENWTALAASLPRGAGSLALLPPLAANASSPLLAPDAADLAAEAAAKAQVVYFLADTSVQIADAHLAWRDFAASPAGAALPRHGVERVLVYPDAPWMDALLLEAGSALPPLAGRPPVRGRDAAVAQLAADPSLTPALVAAAVDALLEPFDGGVIAPLAPAHLLRSAGIKAVRIVDPCQTRSATDMAALAAPQRQFCPRSRAALYVGGGARADAAALVWFLHGLQALPSGEAVVLESRGLDIVGVDEAAVLYDPDRNPAGVHRWLVPSYVRFIAFPDGYAARAALLADYAVLVHPTPFSVGSAVTSLVWATHARCGTRLLTTEMGLFGLLSLRDVEADASGLLLVEVSADALAARLSDLVGELTRSPKFSSSSASGGDRFASHLWRLCSPVARRIQLLKVFTGQSN